MANRIQVFCFFVHSRDWKTANQDIIELCNYLANYVSNFILNVSEAKYLNFN